MDDSGRYKISILTITGFLLVSMLASLVPLGFKANAQAYDYGGANQPLTINGLDGLQGFTSGENQVSLATHMVSQEQGRSYFEVVGFSVSSPYSGQATVYSLRTPMMGVFDTSANTMQIDMSQLADSISGAGTVDTSNVYNVLRYDAGIFIIDMTMQFQGTSDYQTMFSVTAVSMIAPDGTMTAFTLDQPVQLIIDTMTYRMSVPTFPQFSDTFNNYYSGYTSGYYTSVAPVIYQEPIFITPPVFVPVYEPIPIFIAPVFVAPIPVSGPYFIDTFTPNIYCNQFAIAAASASAYAYGGDAFGAASSIAPFVYGGGGDAFAVASAAASAGIGGGGIAVASAAAAAAAGGIDVGSAASAISTAVGGRGGAGAAASAAAAAASGGADVGGIAASAAAAGAAATNGDPVLAANHIADRIRTPGARQAFDAAREAKQSGADPRSIAGRIGDAAARAGGRHVAGGQAGERGRIGAQPEQGAPTGSGTGQVGAPAGRPITRGRGAGRGGEQPVTGITTPGQGRGPDIGHIQAPTGPGGQAVRGRGAGQGGMQPFSGITPGQGRGQGTARQAPISQFQAVSGGGTPSGGSITPGAAHGRAGGAPGQGVTGGAGTARRAPVSQFPAATGGGGQGAIHRGTGATTKPGGAGLQGGAVAPGGAISRGSRQTPQNIQAPGGKQRATPGSAIQAPSGGGRQGISSGGRQAPTGIRSGSSGGRQLQSGGVSGGLPARSGSGIKPQAHGGRAPSSVRSAPASKPNVQSSGFKAPSGGGGQRSQRSGVSMPSGGGQKRSSSGSVKAPSGGGGRVSSGGGRQSTTPRSTGKPRR